MSVRKAVVPDRRAAHVSFSIISILTGAVLLFGYGLKFAGPSANSNAAWPRPCRRGGAHPRTAAGDRHVVVKDPYPVLYIVASNVAPIVSNAIAIVIGVAMWLCGVASVTSMGRMWYAFARDVTAALSVLICVYAAAWFVVTSISTVCLYLAYGIPILLPFHGAMR